MRALIALAFLAGGLIAQTPDADSKGVIRGVVTDSNGLPVSGVLVRAYPGGEPRTLRAGRNTMLMVGSAPSSTTTDEAGKYALTNLAPATYSLKTGRDPESSTYRRINVEAGKEVTLDIVVPANPAISGQVLDQNGDPEVDAGVWLLKSEFEDGMLRQIAIEPKFTGEDGSYAFTSDIEPNRRYYLLVDRGLPKNLDLEKRPPIEVPTYYPSATRMDLAAPVILQPGENRQKVDIKIASAPFYCVAGKIPDAAEFEIREAPLVGTRLVRLRGSVDEHGKYRVCGLSPGQYRLSTQHAATEFTVLSSDLENVALSTDLAHLRVKAEWDDPSSAPTTPKLDARAEAELRKIAGLLGMSEPVSNEDLIRLGARVIQPDPNDTALNDALERDQDREADRGYLAGLFAAGNFLLHVTLNGGAGTGVEAAFSVAVPSEFVLRDGIPPGDYTLDFQVFGKITTYPKEVAYNDVKLTDDMVRLAPGATGTLHLVMATDVSTIAVAVKDAQDNPVPGASVVLIPESVTTAAALARLTVRGQADQSGSYASPALAPGKYRVVATTQTVRWSVPEDLEKVLLAMLQAKSVEVAPKAKLEVTAEPVPIY
jgi:hypothetical protein